MFAFSQILKLPVGIQKAQHRNFFAFLNFIFNRVSKSRIKEVGPDRACAEWLMRNGAYIKWKGETDYVQHYNGLPLDPKIKIPFYISYIRANDASINSSGFAHFSGCKEIVGMEFHQCPYFDDKCIDLLSLVKESLSSLKITSCHEVTDKGLKGILNLTLLNDLTLGDLEGVKDLNSFSKNVQTSLPRCKLEILKPPGNPQNSESVGLFSSPK